jgi:hypothetical protein
MALALGLDKVDRNELNFGSGEGNLKAREEYMVWWVLVVLEK